MSQALTCVSIGQCRDLRRDRPRGRSTPSPTNSLPSLLMYSCSHCDAQYLKWQGQCSTCSKWGTVIEGQASDKPTAKKIGKATAAKSTALFEAGKAILSAKRHTTGDAEVD